MNARIASIAVVLAGCEVTGGGGGASSGGVKITESGTKRGSAGGFASTLAQELGPAEGSLGAAAPGAATATTAGGSAAGSAAGSGAVTSGVAQGSAAGMARGSAAGAGSGSAAGAAQGSAAKVAAAGSAAGTSPGKVDSASGAIEAAVPTGKGKRVYVNPSPELAAIKLELEPNWERDVGEAGTFSLVVKVPGSEETRVFAVKYGLDDQSAPVDCDQYRKFLEEKKVMTPTVNRQRSGACYVESASAFRYMINYGGKRLMCQGSLYKDASSSPLGDLRDKVLMQAKKICETLAL